MTMAKPGTRQTRAAWGAFLASLLLTVQPLAAAPAGGSFDLDLKELKKPSIPAPAARKAPPAKHEKAAQEKQEKGKQTAAKTATAKKRKTASAKAAAKPVEAPTTQTTPATAATTATPAQSTYTVAAGETLYGILTRRYGLGADAANRLMPVVVQQNRLADAASLSAGQKLVIPLAAPAGMPPVAAAQPPAIAVPEAAKTATAADRVILLDARSACPLARQVLEAVAQPVDPQELLHDVTMPAVAAARFEGIIGVLACDLPRAEEYTFRRLLEMQGTQLIAVSGDDPLPQAVQAVADSLGISYLRLSGSPDSYLVRLSGTPPQTLHIRIRTGAGAP